MNAVTAEDVALTRTILLAQQAWNEVAWEAYTARQKAGMFPDWITGHEWLATQPVMPPDPLQQIVYAETELRISRGPTVLASRAVPKKRPYRRKKPPIIPEDRQMAIAMAALEHIESNQSSRTEVA